MKRSADTPADIAIVGFGAAGLSFFVQYVDACMRDNISSTVLIFSVGKKAQGVAYGLAKDNHLLNLNNHVMSVTHTKPDDFYLWQKKHQRIWKKRFPNVKLSDPFPPRRLFGMYLDQCFTEYRALAKRHGIAVEVVADEVIDITPNGLRNAYTLTTYGGKIQQARKILLAVGNLPADTYLQLKKLPYYFHDPWTNLKLKRGSVTTVLGTRLTAIDVALQIAATDPKAKILLASRSGRLPKVIGPSKPYSLTFLSEATLKKNLVKGKLPLERLGKLFIKEIERAEGRRVDWQEILLGQPSTLKEIREEIRIVSAGIHRPWQSVLIAFYPLVPWTWSLLDEKEKKIFTQKYQSAWLTYLAAFPLVNARKLAKLMASGQVEVFSGIQKVDYSPKTHAFCLHALDKTTYVDAVVNATGSGHTFSNSKVLNALDKKHLVQESLAGGIVVDPSTCAVKGSKDIYAIGEMIFGSWLATADLTQVSRQAALVIQDILEV